jgi:hypothetical protein
MPSSISPEPGDDIGRDRAHAESTPKEARCMSEAHGPIDYVLLEFRGGHPLDEVATA